VDLAFQQEQGIPISSAARSETVLHSTNARVRMIRLITISIPPCLGARLGTVETSSCQEKKSPSSLTSARLPRRPAEFDRLRLQSIAVTYGVIPGDFLAISWQFASKNQAW
jgi:hypothetical protein